MGERMRSREILQWIACVLFVTNCKPPQADTSVKVDGATPGTAVPAATVTSMTDEQFRDFYLSKEFRGDPNTEQIHLCALDPGLELRCRSGYALENSDAWACRAQHLGTGSRSSSSCYSDVPLADSSDPVKRRNFFDACGECGVAHSPAVIEVFRNRRFMLGTYQRVKESLSSIDKEGESTPTSPGASDSSSATTDVATMTKEQFRDYYQSLDFVGDPNIEETHLCGLDRNIQLTCKIGYSFSSDEAWACYGENLTSGERNRSACYSDTVYDSATRSYRSIRRNFFDACMGCGRSLSERYSQLRKSEAFIYEVYLKTRQELAPEPDSP